MEKTNSLVILDGVRSSQTRIYNANMLKTAYRLLPDSFLTRSVLGIAIAARLDFVR